MEVQTLPIFGPLPIETCGFLLGRSSSIVKGLQIYPCVINNDYEGEIKIIGASLHGVITVTTNQGISQLVLIPLHPPLSSLLRMKEDKVVLTPLCELGSIYC
jgi:deoxycytidine triphosphate deaminase